MLKMQNNHAIADKMNHVSLRVRKSYSADSLLLKSIIEEVSFRNIDLDSNKEKEEIGIIL